MCGMSGSESVHMGEEGWGRGDGDAKPHVFVWGREGGNVKWAKMIMPLMEQLVGNQYQVL